MPVTVETYPTAAEAARALGPDARFLAGGTLVMRSLNEADPAFRRIVRSTDPALREIRATGSALTLGAAVTMAQILAHRDLAFLHSVARLIGGPAIRVMATIGGNLFAPHPYGDLATALLALDARIVTAQGARPVEDLLRDRARPPLVTAIEIPRPRDGEFGFLKVSRIHPKGVSLLAVAARLPRESGRLRAPRIAFTGMAATPVRALAAERALDGRNLDPASISRAAEAATDGLDPPTDALASAWYRREVAPVHLRRLLESLAR